MDLSALAPALMSGVLVGELIAVRDEGHALVCFAGQADASAVVARTTVAVDGQHVGHAVVLAFECGDLSRPIILGVVRGHSEGLVPLPGQVEVDGERMLITAKDRLVLRCGKASITLTRAGKVLIEGAYVLSRSTGVNRVKGGTVQLN